MLSIERRITALESRVAPGDADRVEIVVICPLTADGAKQEVHCLSDMRGPGRWDRLEGEAEQVFFDRASREACRVNHHPAVLMGEPARVVL